MVQWTNINRNNRSVNTWMSEISGALHLSLPGFMAGRQEADEIQAIYQSFEPLQ